jgi:hypothetical protein
VSLETGNVEGSILEAFSEASGGLNVSDFDEKGWWS